jgi:hypothetical protein
VKLNELGNEFTNNPAIFSTFKNEGFTIAQTDVFINQLQVILEEAYIYLVQRFC